MFNRIKNLWAWSSKHPDYFLSSFGKDLPPKGYLVPKGDGTNEYIPAKRMATIIDMSKQTDEIPTAE